MRFRLNSFAPSRHCLELWLPWKPLPANAQPSEDDAASVLSFLLDPNLDVVIQPAGDRVNPARYQDIGFGPISL